MDVLTTRAQPPDRKLGRDTHRTIALKPHWERLIPAAPHTFAGSGEATQVSPRIWEYCPSGYQNQLIGMCVGMGTSNAAATILRVPPGAVFDPDDPSRDTPRLPNVRLSALWCYRNARTVHPDGGGPGEGAVVAYSMDAVMKRGVVLEATWPDTEQNQRAYRDDTPLPKGAAAEGLRHVVLKAARITSAGQYLDYLSQGIPVIDGVPINSGWQQTADDGAFSLGGQGLGGHCTMSCGFDKRQNRFYKRNSWEQWGARTDDPEFNSDDPAYFGNAGGYSNVGYCPLDQYVETYLTDANFESGMVDAFVISSVPGFDAPLVSPVSAEILFT